MQLKRLIIWKSLGNDKIKKWILPHLSKGKRGFSTKFDLVKIIQTITKRLKIGCQWREISGKKK
ncbi:hypothetical protein H9Q08_19785 [Chryseobacterium sp. PS-8]|uniref:Transposase n=1 Tax=Chryseobacterium indicum TaxID=2766954 RepID=A0ABS9CAC3_9FLAO|nr:hypothetical protein [Chryseobacterium sp. PS-8]MCF2221511.1 hypothetical protein [Chryseobacterium sp. PS-8]